MSVEHNEVNIRTPGLYTSFGGSDINKSVIARNVTKYQPSSINKLGGQAAGKPNITGQVEFTFTTSNMQWTDLFNAFFLTKYTIGAPADSIMHLTQNMIGQAYFYLNGVQIAYTNNWTVASRANKRMQFSKQYNQSINGMTYRSDISLAKAALLEAAGAAGGDGPAGAGFQDALDYPITAPNPVAINTDKEYLDGFFIRDRDSCWIPPNSSVRIVLTIDPLYPLKAVRTPAATQAATTILVDQIELIMPSVMKKEAIPEEYILKFITNSITTQQVAGTDCNKNLTVDPNIVKVAIAFQSNKCATDAVNKTAGGEVLSYPNQNEKTEGTRTLTGAVGTNQLEQLQLQLGSIVNPPQAYDFNTNLHREAYEQYMYLTGKTLSFETQESFMDWLTEPIYLFDFPRPVEDKSTNLIIRAQRKAPNADVQMHIIEMDEQLVQFTYDPKSGACIGTKTLK